jgi:hypothetical protein
MLCIGAILQAISGPVILGEAKLQRSPEKFGPSPRFQSRIISEPRDKSSVRDDSPAGNEHTWELHACTTFVVEHRGCSEFRLQAALLANVTSDRGPAKAGTPNYVHPARKIITQRVVKPDHDSVV